MALNQNLDYGSLPGSVRNAFKGAPRLKRLNLGFLLFKLTSRRTLGGSAGQISPWWSSVDAYDFDAGLANRLKMAKSLNTSVKELTRVLSAVCEDWNSLEYLVTITLVKPVYGLFGMTAGQPRFFDPAAASKRTAGEASSGTANLPGAAAQWYIPNMTFSHARLAKVPIDADTL